MSRHRNVKQLIDEADYDDYRDDDLYDEEDDEEEIYVGKAAAPAKAAAGKPKPAKASSAAGAGTKPQHATATLAASKLASPPASQPPLVVVAAGPKPAASKLADALLTRPAPAGPVVAVPPPLAPVPAFDFASTPSPDAAIQAAQRRVDRTGAVVPLAFSAPAAASAAQPPTAAAAAAIVAGAKGTSALASVVLSTGSVATTAPKTKAAQKRDEEDDAADAKRKPLVSLVVVGHVDAGKSTLMGHLLYDLQYVSQKDMHAFEKESKDIGKASFKYAWVLDEHAEERSRGVTIDVGVKRFETANRRVVLLDAPGHRDFVPNMITGACQADSAFLVVPAAEGEFESSFMSHSQTREHAVLLHRLGMSRLVVVVNKMDTVGWSQTRFEEVKAKVQQFLSVDAPFETVTFIPVSGLTGENLVKPKLDSWYQGPTLAGVVDSLPPAKRPVHKPLRMVLTDVYKSMALGSNTVGGKIEAGMLRVGDAVVVLPLNEPATVKAIHVHGEPVRRAKAGDNCEIGLVGQEQLQRISPGMVVCPVDAPVPVSNEFRARVACLPLLKAPLLNGSQGTLHVHAAEVPATLTRIERILAPKPNEKPRFVRSNETADVIFKCEWPICLESAEDLRPLSRLLFRMGGITVAAGLVSEPVLARASAT